MQIEFIGEGYFKKIFSILNNLDSQRILLVTGKNLLSLSGAKSLINSLSEKVEVVIFNDFVSNPRLEDVETGINILRQGNFDLIISIGGGSVIDMAKLINILNAQKDRDLFSYIKNSELMLKKGLPMVAIPTTIGTGSEATHFAVVYVDKIKYSLAHSFMLPDYVIIDAELSYSLPAYIAASSGMDALSQAVESYWSVKSTKISKQYAAEAIILILGVLQDAVEGQKKARVTMAKAANLAGKAINITTTTAPHAISYPITSTYGLQHGHAVSVILGEFFEVNYNFKYNSVTDPRGCKYLKTTMSELFRMFGVNSPLECKFKWKNLMHNIGLESSLNKIGVCNKADVEKIINNINIQRLNNNPVQLSSNELIVLLLGMVSS
jgi:alcohol dehydrogenase